ncbi:hypothetical protein JAAARDRAFT_610789 [Jaapia argillacea MUCL 33604]|uniref:Uncharacterized protein n=1 Tax=Jaapia argillacea MUCL 33604 TaxID=933084 RepID=A0A067P831_9AGAM|nr:hypothetical protein JAAARDRAFT_610789 [Jaapia argillacea MUCL 33604]
MSFGAPHIPFGVLTSPHSPNATELWATNAIVPSLFGITEDERLTKASRTCWPRQIRGPALNVEILQSRKVGGVTCFLSAQLRIDDVEFLGWKGSDHQHLCKSPST